MYHSAMQLPCIDAHCVNVSVRQARLRRGGWDRQPPIFISNQHNPLIEFKHLNRDWNAFIP